MLKKCTFFGHRDFDKLDFNEKVYEILRDLIVNKNVSEFLSGGMGNFDRICEGYIRKLKKEFPYVKLKNFLPYLEYPAVKNFKRDIQLYDEIVIPNTGAENFRNGIRKRNFYIVDNSDYFISGIYRNEGEAFIALEYARKKENIEIINIFK